MATRRVAGRRSGPGGRSIIALLLVGFVLVTTGVIFRRVYGVGQARDLQKANATLDALQAERIRVEGAIRDASSRARLQPIAEQRLNMHIAQPDQQIFLSPPPTARPSAIRPPHDSL